MAVVAVDQRGLIRAANATAEKFFGVPLAASQSVSVAAIIDGVGLNGEASDEELVSFNARGRSGLEGQYLNARCFGGRNVPVDIRVARFEALGERFVTLFIQDVSSVIEAEAAVQELRVQITQNWRLNSMGEVASMVAHELNQPLSAISNYLHGARTLLTRGDGSVDALLGLLDSAETQAQRAGDTIRRLRALMSRDTGYHAPENMADVIDEILPILLISARQLDADLDCQVDPGDRATCDRVQIQQIVVNLVRNATEAPPAASRRLVQIRGLPLPSGAYQIVIEDNGPGISPDLQKRLFEPLASSKPGGMGLGLSICRTIVEAHGGHIEVTPSALGGAAFTFTLNERVEPPA